MVEVLGTKNRYMLVTKYDEINNMIEMINVSSVKGKERKLIYNSNIQLINYFPLPVPTFAKLDIVYSIKDFQQLENYIAFDGEKINEWQFHQIIDEKNKYQSKYNAIKNIGFTRDEFDQLNNVISKKH